MKPHPQKVKFNIAYKVIPEWHILDSEESPKNNPTTLDEPLPMAAEGLQLEPTHIYFQQQITTHCARSLLNHLDNFQSLFQNNSCWNIDTTYSYLKTLLTAPGNTCMPTSECPPLTPQPQGSWETYPADTSLLLQNQPPVSQLQKTSQ